MTSSSIGGGGGGGSEVDGWGWMGGGWGVNLTRGLLTHAIQGLVCCQFLLIRRFMTRVINRFGSKNARLFLFYYDGLNEMDPSLIIL